MEPTADPASGFRSRCHRDVPRQTPSVSRPRLQVSQDLRSCFTTDCKPSAIRVMGQSVPADVWTGGRRQQPGTEIRCSGRRGATHQLAHSQTHTQTQMQTHTHTNADTHTHADTNANTHTRRQKCRHCLTHTHTLPSLCCGVWCEVGQLMKSLFV